MSETPILNAPVYEHGYVTGRYLTAVADGPDDDHLMDFTPAKGKVIFTPETVIRRHEGPSPALVVQRPVECPINSQGYLTSPDGWRGVSLIVGIYSVRFEVQGAQVPGPKRIEVKETHTPDAPLDLVLSMPEVVPPGSVVVVNETTAQRAEAAAARAEAVVTNLESEVRAVVLASPELKGERGAPGPAPSIKIGTVTSGPTPSATITGTSPDLTLGLVLPKGDRGDTGGGSGSGIEEVSGTVTLDATGPAFRQVYATGAATVQTEPLAAGQVAIFRRLAGAWQVRVMNADGSVKDPVWRAPGAPDTRTGVIAVGPTWQDDTAKGGGTWTTPTQVGVVYSPASGTATPGQQVTVTAAASDGTKYRLDGATSWTHAFPADPNGPLSITETFDGAAGTPVVGKTTTTGARVFYSGAGTTNLVVSKSLVLSGAGAAVLDPADTATNAGVSLVDLPASPLEATLTYANHTGASVARLGVQQVAGEGMTLIYARSTGKVEVYRLKPWTKLAEVATPSGAADAGTLRIRRTNTAFEAYAGDTLLHTMPSTQGADKHFVGIALQGGAVTQITDLSVKAV